MRVNLFRTRAGFAVIRTIALVAAISLTRAAVGDGERPASFVARARHVYPLTEEVFGPIDNGIVVVRDGRIVAVGADIEIPRDLPFLDLRDQTIIPGLVNAASALAGEHTGDDSVGPAYDALDAFDSYGVFAAQLATGTTTVHIDPGGHRLVTGQGAVVKLAGPAAGRELRRGADVCVNLGVFGPPEKMKLAFYASSDEAIQPGQRQRPDSRMGQYLELDERVRGVQELQKAGERAWRERGEFDIHAQTLARLWAARTPLRMQCRRGADIAGAVAWLKKQSYPGYLVGLAEGGSDPALLIHAGLPAVVRIEQPYAQPAWNVGGDPDAFAPDAGVPGLFSRLAQEQAKAMKVALAGAEGDPNVDLRMIAAMAVRSGLPRQTALEAITRRAAEIVGVAERVGSLAPGKDADLVVLSGDPIEIGSHVREVYVEGRRVFCAPASTALVVRAGTIWVGDGTTLRDGSVLVEDGKIRAVGRRVPVPPGAQIVDAGDDAFVAPGFIDAHGHLGLEGDRSAATPDVPIADVVSVAGREFLRVARSGVTTVLLTAYEASSGGSRVAAIKTSGAGRENVVVRETAGMKFSMRGKDPLVAIEEIRTVFKSAREYEEKWKKYQDELKKWEEARAKGLSTVEKKAEGETTVTETKADPITGMWEFTISGAPLPESFTGTMTLKLTGEKIEGRLSDPTGGGEDASLSGTLNGTSVVLDIEQETPVGKPQIRATLDREDHMEGAVHIAQFAISFNATRTDKSPVEFKMKRTRKKDKEGRPLPPKVDERLEPARAVLAQRAAAVVDVRTGAEIAAVLKLFVDELKLPVVLLNAEDADLHAARISKGNASVIAPTRVVQQRERKAYHQAADLVSKGVRIAFQSDAEDGAANLPLMALYAAQQGLGGDAALRALTIDAARIFRIDDRVGSVEVGKDGDLLIFDGHPFDAGSRLERVIVSGQEVPQDDAGSLFIGSK